MLLRLPRFIAALFFSALLFASANAAVVINEILATESSRLLQWDASGVPQVGTGPRWYQAAYNDSIWQTGTGPFGYGTLTNGPTAISTNLQTAVQYLTTTTYFRKNFTVTASDATRPDQVQLVVDYNDGFVVFLNGVEVARRNGGPTKKFVYHDQPAYNRETFAGTAPIPTTTNSETINLGVAAALLSSGSNVLAIQLLNAYAADTTYYLKASLQISGAPTVALVNYNDAWKFFPGVVEPSGSVLDPTQLGSGRQQVPWGTVTFDDATWSSGAGPFGFGSVGTLGTNVQAPMLNLTPSLYTRVVFTATAAQAADPLALKLVMGNDDGFVAYLNGVEVARRRVGVPNTFVAHDAVADSDQSSVQNETILIDAASKLLVTGNNVLAIQAHNYSANNADFLIKADLQTNAGVTLAANNATWKYLVGTVEPIPDPTGEEEDSSPEGPDSAVDWIELYNNGASAVSLAGWRLSDDAVNNAKWVFPNVSIPAGGYLVVIADNLDITSPGAGGYLHTNFGLDRGGEFLGLYDAAGTIVSQLAPQYPAQVPFYSYGRDGAGNYRYSDLPTPGAANAGNFFTGLAATPTVNVPGRFYAAAQSVTLSCATPGAVIRYTTNGAEPTATSTVASSALSISANTALRARAFATGTVPSDIITHTYLIAQSAARQSLPATCLTGDETQAFYRPFGVFSVVNNATTNYTAAIWSNHPGATTLAPPNTTEDPTLYNAPMQSGKPAERPISFEILHTDATADLRIGSFLRCAGSPYSRQRYVLTNHNSATPNSLSPWTTSATEKPQLNIFFRDDVGPSPLHYALVPGSPVTQYENIRLRAGKNDISNPFIRDEFTRRLMIDMGQITVRGDFTNVYFNGSFKGYFNTCERPREPFFQQARGSDLKFDVRNITVIADGDTLDYNEMVSYAKTHNMAVFGDYQGLLARVDPVNIADYIILNAHAAMADWPGNNYVMDRERSTTGVWRFSVWDGEGGYGGFSRNPAYKIFNDIVSGSVSGETVPAKLLFTVMKNSPEWRLLCADRIQKHLFNNGALTDAKLTALFTLLAARVQPIMAEMGKGTVSTFLNIWLNGQGDTTRYTLSGVTTGSIVNCPSRRTALFTGYTDDTASGVFVPAFLPAQNIWPATLAPAFSQFGGNVPAGFQLAITNPNGVGTIYYTTNGLDPRAVGGAAQGSVYTSAISIAQPLTAKARVLNTNGEWSPLTEASFAPPTTLPLIITELMYNPPALGAVDGDEFEFVEIKNVGATAVNLAGCHFTDGIDFTFPAGSSVPAGGFVVLAKNAAQFAVKYPGISVLGSYGPGTSLSDGGETVTLADVNNATIFSVTYADTAPWPTTPDGTGPSLVPLLTNTNPAPNTATYWRASANSGGSPGADDPPVLPTDFARWQNLRFSSAQLADPNISGLSADPDGDGLSNLQEFTRGSNPFAPDAASAPIVSLANDGGSGPYLTLQYRRVIGLQGVQFHGDTAAAPGAWTLDSTLTVGLPAPNGDGTETVTLRDTIPSTGTAQRFIRLRLIGN